MANSLLGKPTGRDSGQQPTGHERRATHQAVARWAAVQAMDRAPKIADFVPPQEKELGQQFLLLKADPMLQLSVFISCGESVLFDLGGDPIGMPFLQPLPSQIRTNLRRAFATAQDRLEPIHDEGTYNAQAGVEIRYRCVFLPVASEGLSHHDYIFGAFGSKQFADSAPATT
jgi:hypothetical protein